MRYVSYALGRKSEHRNMDWYETTANVFIRWVIPFLKLLNVYKHQ